MTKRARLVCKEDGSVVVSGSKYNGKYLLENLLVCGDGDCGESYRRRTERGKWSDAARAGLRKAKMPALILLPWMKDGYRMPWAQLYARMAFMTKVSSEMKLIKFRFSANIF